MCTELYRSGGFQIRPTAGLTGRSSTRTSREPITREREGMGRTECLENEPVNR